MTKNLHVYASDVILTYDQTMKLTTIIDSLEQEYLNVQADILKHDRLTISQHKMLEVIDHGLQSLKEARRSQFESDIWFEKLKEFLA